MKIGRGQKERALESVRKTSENGHSRIWHMLPLSHGAGQIVPEPKQHKMVLIPLFHHRTFDLDGSSISEENGIIY